MPTTDKSTLQELAELHARVDDYERQIRRFLSERTDYKIEIYKLKEIIEEHSETITARNLALGVERDRNAINESLAKEVVKVNRQMKADNFKLRTDIANLNNQLNRKKCTHVYEEDTHGIEMINDPEGKEFAIGGTNTKSRFRFDPWCGGRIPNPDKL